MVANRSLKQSQKMLVRLAVLEPGEVGELECGRGVGLVAREVARGDPLLILEPGIDFELIVEQALDDGEFDVVLRAPA